MQKEEHGPSTMLGRRELAETEQQWDGRSLSHLPPYRWTGLVGMCSKSRPVLSSK